MHEVIKGARVSRGENNTGVTVFMEIRVRLDRAR